MKKIRFLQKLVLVGSLFVVCPNHPSFTLQAVTEYFKTSELKRKKIGSAATLALSYAAHRYYNKRLASFIAVLALIGTLHSSYKDICLVGDLQRARKGEDVEDGRVEEYMDSVCFDRTTFQGPSAVDLGLCDYYSPSWLSALQSQVGLNFSPFPLFCIETRRHLEEEFFKSYCTNKNNLSQLRGCAKNVFEARQFEKNVVNEKIGGGARLNTPVIMLQRIMDSFSNDCNNDEENNDEEKLGDRYIAIPDNSGRKKDELINIYKQLTTQEGLNIKSARRQ